MATESLIAFLFQCPNCSFADKDKRLSSITIRSEEADAGVGGVDALNLNYFLNHGSVHVDICSHAGICTSVMCGSVHGLSFFVEMHTDVSIAKKICLCLNIC